MAGLLDYVSGIADEAKKNASSVADEAKKNVQGLLADPKQQLMKTLNNLTARVAASQAKTKAAWATHDPDIIAQDALDGLQTALSFAPLGITAWHGSPHKFNKFSTDKIGTGEGAQAYGHGLYLAESPAVANEYAAKLGKPELVFGGKPITQLNVSQEAKDAAKWIESRAGAMSYGAQGRTARDDFSRLPEKIRKELGNVDLFDGGNLYKTDIPEEAVARFLDWDKPLSQQADILKAVFDNGLQHGMYRINGSKNVGDFTGGDLIQSLDKNRIGSARLQKLGIPGIRYLDGGSRGAGTGTNNFVAFDPEMIRILERNGQATGNIPWQPGEWRGLLGNN